MAFCTSLRKRASFSSILPDLGAGGFLRGNLGVCQAGCNALISLSENNLSSHDISIPIVQRVRPGTASQGPARHLLFLLFSGHAVAPEARSQTLDRIRRFAVLTGGTDLRIVLLLAPPPLVNTGDVRSQDCYGAVAHSQLQVLLHESTDIPTIPLLPLATLEYLPTLLKNHMVIMTTPQNVSHLRQPPPNAWTLLRQCTMNPPMDETIAYFITDTFVNLKELAEACSMEADVILGPVAVTSSDRTIVNDHISPYFSSPGGSMGTGAEEKERNVLAKKLYKLRALDEIAARDIVTFWQAEWLID